MEQMVRRTPADSPTIVYQSKFRGARTFFPPLAALLVAAVTEAYAQGVASRFAGWTVAVIVALLAFKRRIVRLDPANDLLTESRLHLFAGKTKTLKLSEYGSISVAVQANDNDAEDGDFLSLFEVYIVGNGKAPILLFASQDRPAVEREVELLASRLKCVVGWHARSYGE